MPLTLKTRCARRPARHRTLRLRRQRHLAALPVHVANPELQVLAVPSDEHASCEPSGDQPDRCERGVPVVDWFSADRHGVEVTNGGKRDVSPPGESAA